MRNEVDSGTGRPRRARGRRLAAAGAGAAVALALGVGSTATASAATLIDPTGVLGIGGLPGLPGTGVFTLTPTTQTAVTGVNVVPNDATANATGVSYNISFTATSGISDGGTISLLAPFGMTLPANTGEYLILYSAPGGAAGPPAPQTQIQAATVSQQSPQQATVTLTAGQAIPAGDNVFVSVGSMQNPAAGSNYSFEVSTGDDQDPVVSPAVTIADGPPAPTGVTATPGDTSAFVSWTEPAGDGSSDPVSSFSVAAVPEVPGIDQASHGDFVTSPTATDTLSGLVNGLTYDINVEANGKTNTHAASAPVAVTPTSGSEPAVVTGVGAVADPGQDGALDVSWTPSTDTGVSGYLVVATPPSGPPVATVAQGGTTATGVLSGLTDGVLYSVTVQARNNSGFGRPSDPPVTVSPSVPGAGGGTGPT
ncbi:MAG TPA: fibronectin type III domain-containing protein, partial [Acidimicrobiales bacterium]|nr:fibronectin type III domain-containing protein [Acidimicrobiales bacterium]